MKTKHTLINRLNDKKVQADNSKIEANLSYKPSHTISQGLKEALQWYIKNV